jgi:orotidine-5'-phosphate decarboxylase
MMTEPSKAKTPSIKPKDRIIVALDVETADEARAIVSEIGGGVGAFKIGLQLFTSAGPAFVREITSSGVKVFLDLKFHDIPNTVAKASVEAAKLGVWMFNMHAGGGREMMSYASSAIRKFCEREGIEIPIMLAVTALTSSNATTLKESGIELSVEDYVKLLAVSSAESGLGGIVASAYEIGSVRSVVKSDNFCIVTPGIRPRNETIDDQKRVMTPAAAIAAGSDYLVIGRPITAALDRKAAVRKITEEIEKTN